MNEYSLELKYKDRTVFTSKGNWLHPLFELETFLNNNDYNRNELILFDKIIGKASALLIVRLKITQVKGGTVSSPAEKMFKKWDIRYTAETRVPYIDCKTESILADVDDPDEVYRIIRERAGIH